MVDIFNADGCAAHITSLLHCGSSIHHSFIITIRWLSMMPLREQQSFLYGIPGESGCCEVVLQVSREACECSGHHEQEVPLRDQPAFLWPLR